MKRSMNFQTRPRVTWDAVERARAALKARGRTKKIPLLPGLRWKGSLTILKRIERDGERLFVVAFDAEVVNPTPHSLERFVFDHATLTAKQLADWTGHEDPPA